MEAANEAARRAVNGILDATSSAAPRCQTWKLHEPAVLAPFRRLDQVRWRLGRRAVKPPVRVNPYGELEHHRPPRPRTTCRHAPRHDRTQIVTYKLQRASRGYS